MEIIKPSVDKRSYKYLKLSNDLTVLIIQDQTSTKCACSINISIGSILNPLESLGIAHFLEHMLFMGTKTFPDENNFLSFLTLHGGNRNGYTATENTVFYYDVNCDYFIKSLEMFSEFFYDPLLKENCVDRELNNINSEYEKGLVSDVRRRRDVLKEFSNLPYSKFTVGNYETLKKKNIREKLLKFFNENYSANLMNLVVYGNQEIDELEKAIVKNFSKIENKKKKMFIFETLPYKSDLQYKKYFQIVPIKDIRSLKMFFCIPYSYKDYKTSCVDLLAELVGHEGTGSLYAMLKQRGLVTALISGCSKYNGFLFFTCEFKLTPEGELKYEDVIYSFFQYVKLLKESTIEEMKSLFAEFKQIRKFSFQFEDTIKQYTYCRSVCEKMRKCSVPSDILSFDRLYHEFVEKNWKEYLKFLHPDKLVILWSSKKFENEKDLQESKWYKSKFRIEDIDDEFFKKCKNPSEIDPLIHLPPKNIFVPKDLKIKSIEKKILYPQEFHKDSLLEVYFKQDYEFERPKLCSMVKFEVLESRTSAINAFMQILLGKLIKDSFNEISYFAEISNLRFFITGTKSGFEIQVIGYNDSINKLLFLIIDKLFNGTLDKDRFGVIYEDVRRKYLNIRKVLPISQAKIFSNYILITSKAVNYEHLITASESVTFEGTVDYYKSIVNDCLSIQSLFIGNNTSDEVKKTIQELEKIIDTKNKKLIMEGETFHKRVGILEKNYVYRMGTKNEKDNNSACVTTVQIGLRSMRMDVMLDLLQMFIKSDFFDQLRNKEHIGYITQSHVCKVHNVKYYRFLLQSCEKDPIFMLERINAFFIQFKEKVLTMKDEDFKVTVNCLKDKYAEPFKRLYEEAIFYWKEIDQKQYKFDRKLKRIEYASKITKQEFIDFYLKYFINEKCSLTVQLFSPKDSKWLEKKKSKEIEYIHDIEKFRRSIPSYPSFVKF